MAKRIKLQGRERTSVHINKNIKEADIIALRFEDMVIRTPKGDSFYLNRLRYVGCPTKPVIDKSSGTLMLAERDELVRHLYELTVDVQATTTHTNLRNLLQYIKYIDSINFQSDMFELDIMSKCIKHYNGLALKGFEPSKAASIREGLGWYLKKVNRFLDVKKLPNAKEARPSGKDGALDLESELKPIAKTLLRGFKGFVEAIKNNEWLDIHPMFDDDVFKEQVKAQKWPGNGGKQKFAFKKALFVNPGLINSPLSNEQLRLQLIYIQASRNALFLFYMLTGMNPSVLAPIKHRQVIFKDIGNGRYVFESEKYRANYKSVDSALGFSKYAKSMIESWVEVSKIMYERLGVYDIDHKPLMPYFDTQGDIKDFTYTGTEPNLINKFIVKLHGITVNATRFRNTKSDVLMVCV